ncbi:thioredoxin domain-containing protein [Brevibacterium yomogidense]|uniref:thioredoxin domain-containing protein n=1 Tax=Brevibacterium yomogidense TaxID=946573 RepID=UPI0018E01F9E|nr:DUF255 domain-containing protein [Brevibacterium yomogidense]
MTNQLASSTSPYLRAHADNPVEWRPWGRDAFVEARERDVPVLVSIGYSTCHWCHVMARESFSDPAVGELLRESIVAVKLDREELPAVDAFYMDALLAMRGQGGWPLNVFTTPDARPFFAGTYFPPEPRDGMPSFSQVVTTIARTWSQDRERAESIADQLASSLVRLPDLSMGLPADAPVPEVDDDTLTAAAENLLATEDTRWGGFGATPKFPPMLSLIHLLRRHDRFHTPEAPAGSELAAVRRTFAGIAAGGMRDQVDGGIARYSVDAQWHIPHFEKMLFDNAMYLKAAVHWCEAERQREPGSRFTRLALREVHDTARFLLERLQLPNGGFASGLDADSVDDDAHRTEGAYYLERADEVPGPFTPLGPVDAAAPGRPFAIGFPAITDWVHGESAGDTGEGAPESGATPRHVTPDGTGPSGTEPSGTEPSGTESSGGEADAAPWETSAAVAARHELADRRAQRQLPNRDAKLVSEWNGLAIIALEEAGRRLGEDEWITAARRAFDAVVESNWGDSLVRSSTDGVAGPGSAGLADAAQMAVAAHALGEHDWFRRMLGDALGFVVFPQRDREGSRDGAEGDADQPSAASGTGSAHRWEGASLLDAHGDGIVPARGSDPLDDSTPSGRSALIEALRAATEGEDDTVDANGRPVSTQELADLRRRLLASVMPALQQATRSLGWVLAEAEVDAAG